MIEVLKQMQEALREYHYYTIDAGLPNQSMLNKGYAAFQAGKQAIAELESQKPASDYERGVIDGMQKQAQSSVDKAVNAMAQRTWVGLTSEETERLIHNFGSDPHTLLDEVDARLKARNI
jgi:hypothetical protein